MKKLDRGNRFPKHKHTGPFLRSISVDGFKSEISISANDTKLAPIVKKKLKETFRYKAIKIY